MMRPPLRWSGLILALGLWCAGCGAPVPPAPKAEAVPPTHIASPPAEVEAAWPTYHGSTTLDGVADVALPDALALAWRYETGAKIFNTPVVGAGRIAVADDKGTIYALDLDGKLAWSRTFTRENTDGRPPSKVYFDAPLAIFDGVLIAGDSNGTVYALNVVDGTTRWECKTDAVILGSPNLAEVTVDGAASRRLYFIDQTAGGLSALEFETGKLLWQAEGRDRCDGSPAANGSHVAYGSCASAVHIFDPSNGKMVREITLGEDAQVAGGVVLLGDLLYTGSRSGSFLHANAATGEVYWRNKDCQGEAFNTPAVGADTIVFGANDATLFALNRSDGRLRWKQKLGDTPSSPVIARDKVLLTESGTLRMLRLSDGETLWSFPISDEATSPAVAGSLVLVGADDGTVTAFGPKRTE